MLSFLEISVIALGLAVIAYLGIALALITISPPRAAVPVGGNSITSFDSLQKVDQSDMPGASYFQARDGEELAYRYYPADSHRVLILIHGSTGNSTELHAVARVIKEQSLVQVYLPDVRGHGQSGKRRGDASYIGQLEDDVADLMEWIRGKDPRSNFILGGHSSGGGLSVRFAGGPYGDRVIAYLLLAPFLGHDSPTAKLNSGGWVRPFHRRILGLKMFNAVGITSFNHLPIVDFFKPKEVRDGRETLAWSYRLRVSYAPRDYKKDLIAIKQPLLCVIGTEDECFHAEEYKPLIGSLPQGRLDIFPGLKHVSLLTARETHERIIEWLKSLDEIIV